MSYNWDFEKSFIGTVACRDMLEEDKRYIYNLYSGNGLFICLAEWEKTNRYQVITFAIDNEHFKNCLKDNVYDNFYSWNLKENKNSRTIAKLLATNNKTPYSLKIGYGVEKRYLDEEDENKDENN